VADFEFLDWDGGERIIAEIDRISILQISNRDDIAHGSTRDDMWEPSIRGGNPGQIG
jgi:hypothetical protein